MSVELAPKQSGLRRLVEFYHEVTAEMKKVTWPDWPQVRQLSIGVVIISLFIGFLIFLMDTVIRTLVVNLLPRLFQ